MPTTTQHAPGTFSWPELATSDQAAAKTFYAALFGWTMNDTPMGEGETYTMIHLGDRGVGALYTKRKEEANLPPHWNSYVTVEKADAAAAKAKQLGGTLLMEPFDVMDVGRMAVIQDPTGAVFCVWEAKNHVGAGVLGETGSLVWTELMTPDTNQAGAFYSGLFGWRPQSMDMGGGMTYTVFNRGDVGAGGMMGIPPDMQGVPPHWKPYFAVENADATVAKATQLGGKLIVPPTDIPGTGRFAIIEDPQGATFGILKPSPRS
jgi:uncharacterized protein